MVMGDYFHKFTGGQRINLHGDHAVDKAGKTPNKLYIQPEDLEKITTQRIWSKGKSIAVAVSTADSLYYMVTNYQKKNRDPVKGQGWGIASR